MTQSSANAKPEVTSVCIYESRANATIPPVAVNHGQLRFAHFPGLLNELIEHTAIDDFGGMISVKVDLHLLFRSSIAHLLGECDRE